MAQPVIAVVDDDQTMRQLLESLLLEHGYAPRCWASGLAAYGDMVRNPPDLIILDLRLGDDPEAGWNVLSLLRIEPRTERVPVILISADREFLHRREHILRMKKYATALAKPFDVGTLLEKIEQALETTPA